MGNKKAYLVSCSDHYGHRLEALDCFLRSRGYETHYITSDFDHTEKSYYTCAVPGCIQLHTLPYYKNLSLQRARSHRRFAKSVKNYLEALPEPPDLLAVLVPPNFLSHYAAVYKRRHPTVTLLMDLFDLWPETMPVSAPVKALLHPFFRAWASLRDRNLGKADFITAECRLFLDRLSITGENSAAIYLCKAALGNPLPAPRLSPDRLELCYLGAINNIIGISEICSLIRELTARKPVTLHVIGKGENKDLFLQSAREAGAQVEFYGAVYDQEKILQIMARCHFGLNIMRPTVCVGLTMKSLDYFRAGLPVISSIPADTQRLLEQYGAGIQTGPDCARKILDCTPEQCLAMRENTQTMFRELFTREVILREYDRHLGNLV